jgi:urease accessory protein
MTAMLTKSAAHPGESRDPSGRSGSAADSGWAPAFAGVSGSESTHQLRLLTWLSPAFPVGAFAYSHGLEQAIRDGVVTDGAELCAWISALLTCGSGWTDAVLCKAAWTTATDATLTEVAELAEALAPSLERRRETLAQGEAFATAVKPWLDLPPLPYPVAVGAAAGRLAIPAPSTLTAWLHAFCANLVSAAVRAVPLGQTQGVATLAALEPVILAAAARAARSTLDDLGSASILSDIAAMRHETLQPRLFIS